MKKLFIVDILKRKNGEVELLGWINRINRLGKIIFIDIVDSTGVAEKIPDLEMLKIRMDEKGKLNDPRYRWIEEVHQVGCVPHAAMGMGVERLVRWLLGIPHVKDTIPFPRLFRRKIYP